METYAFRTFVGVFYALGCIIAWFIGYLLRGIIYILTFQDLYSFFTNLGYVNEDLFWIFCMYACYFTVGNLNLFLSLSNHIIIVTYYQHCVCQIFLRNQHLLEHLIYQDILIKFFMQVLLLELFQNGHIFIMSKLKVNNCIRQITLNYINLFSFFWLKKSR